MDGAGGGLDSAATIIPHSTTAFSCLSCRIADGAPVHATALGVDKCEL
jgi:hypothetical protein